MKKKIETTSLAHILHELNNKLTVVLLNIELLSPDLNKNQKKSIDKISSDLEKIKNLIKKIES